MQHFSILLTTDINTNVKWSSLYWTPYYEVYRDYIVSKVIKYYNGLEDLWRKIWAIRLNVSVNVVLETSKSRLHIKVKIKGTLSQKQDWKWEMQRCIENSRSRYICNRCQLEAEAIQCRNTMSIHYNHRHAGARKLSTTSTVSNFIFFSNIANNI